MPMPDLRYSELHLADGSFSALCGQINRDYSKFAKKVIFPRLGMESLSYRELRVLLCIAYYETPVKGAFISQIMRYDPATVSRATALLIEAGYVDKQESLLDFRTTNYKATQKGDAIVGRYRQLLDEAYAQYDDDAELQLTLSEQEQLLGLLKKMRDRTFYLATKSKKAPSRRPQAKTVDLKIVR